MDAQTPPARPKGALIELLPKPCRLDGIGANQHRLEIPAPQVDGRHLNEALDDHRRCIRFADSYRPSSSTILTITVSTVPSRSFLFF
jgi:hypothetical protein